jgi:glutamine synthetase
MLSLEELTTLIKSGEIDVVLAVFPDMYGRLLGKRITGTFFLDHVVADGYHACDYLLACDMEMDPVPGYSFTSWESGYGDFHLVCDWNTLRRAAWLPQTAMVLCDVYRGDDAVEISPRQMLRRQLTRASEMGFAVNAGSEIELYLFDESYESAAQKRYHDLKPMSGYIEDYHVFQSTKEEPLVGSIRRALEDSGVPVEFSKGEWGPGQQEINLRYSEALTQCDANTIYKQAAKEIAFAQGKSVTFMAKWDENLAGSSMHIHVSLADAESGKNTFPGDDPLGPIMVSDTFRWFLGGWMAAAYELTACYAPYVTSYKRFQEGSFAPTGIAWSYDNRTAGFRVVGEGHSLRIECRIPGADANPYIAYAAVLASGLEGIARKIEPYSMFEGDIYSSDKLPRVPRTLRDATAAFEASRLARSAFGQDAFEHYLHFLKTEQRKFDEVVTCWERARFFERV